MKKFISQSLFSVAIIILGIISLSFAFNNDIEIKLWSYGFYPTANKATVNVKIETEGKIEFKFAKVALIWVDKNGQELQKDYFDFTTDIREFEREYECTWYSEFDKIIVEVEQKEFNNTSFVVVGFLLIATSVANLVIYILQTRKKGV